MNSQRTSRALPVGEDRAVSGVESQRIWAWTLAGLAVLVIVVLTVSAWLG